MTPANDADLPNGRRVMRWPLVIGLAVSIAAVASLGGYDVWFRARDQRLKHAGEALLRAIRVTPILQPVRREYISQSSWATDYNPRWIYHYWLTEDKQVTFQAVKEAFVAACGQNTPDAPYRVSGDEQNHIYIESANCRGHQVLYRLGDDGRSATITVNP